MFFVRKFLVGGKSLNSNRRIYSATIISVNVWLWTRVWFWWGLTLESEFMFLGNREWGMGKNGHYQIALWDGSQRSLLTMLSSNKISRQPKTSTQKSILDFYFFANYYCARVKLPRGGKNA
jgi:hypothetical protein